MATNTSPSPKSSGTIRIRPYQDKDERDVIDLYAEGNVGEREGAPLTLALNAHLKSRSAILSYGVFFIGLGLAPTRSPLSIFLRRVTGIQNTGLVMRLLAPLVSVLSALHFVLYRRHIRAIFEWYVKAALESDLMDAGRYYMGFKRLESETKGKKMILYGSAKESHDATRGGLRETIFWVAEEVETRKVVGIIGLDATLDPDPQTLELRRMAVHSDYRRRGIGYLLIEALVDHAKALNSNTERSEDRFRFINLSTTPFHGTAVYMYGRKGWRKTKNWDLALRHEWLGWAGINYALKVEDMVLEL